MGQFCGSAVLWFFRRYRYFRKCGKGFRSMPARSPTNNDADLADLQQLLLRLAEVVDRAIVGATWALAHRDTDEAQHVVDGDAAIDELRYALEQDAILLLAGPQFLADDAR